MIGLGSILFRNIGIVFFFNLCLLFLGRRSGLGGRFVDRIFGVVYNFGVLDFFRIK